MTSPSKHATSPRRSPLAWALLAAAVLLPAGLGLGFFIGGLKSPPPAKEIVIKESPNVILAVKDLARLQTSEMHIERVVDIRDKQSRLFGTIQAQDAILLIAAGDVSAGVDLTKMKDGDIVVDETNKSVRVTLPKAEVFSAALDAKRTYVHSRTTDALAKANHTLETQARQEAVGSIRQAALSAGLLARADANAKSTISALLRSLGYTSITVQAAAD